ncbi:MAG: glycosyltransferase involved in cell wall biosynthesis, partial [Verrucomicrobiales bacterium]
MVDETEKQARPRFSLVVPVFNEFPMLPALRERLPKSLDAVCNDWEIVFVNDGSTDGSLDDLLVWHASEKRISVVNLSRNFGHQAAVFAGLSHARGAVVGVIDADLQDPPELLAEMYEKLLKEADVVYGVRTGRKEGPILKSCYWVAYRVMNALADHPLPLDSGDFCLMRRKVLDQLLQMSEHRLFLRGLRSWVGLRQVPFVYERAPREFGETKYRFRDLWCLMRDGVYGFTTFPLKVMRWLGGLVVVASACYVAYLLIVLLFGGTAPRGFSTLIVAACFFGGSQLLATGIVGEYVARIYEESQRRPRFIVDEFHTAS